MPIKAKIDQIEKADPRYDENGKSTGVANKIHALFMYLVQCSRYAYDILWITLVTNIRSSSVCALSIDAFQPDG